MALALDDSTPIGRRRPQASAAAAIRDSRHAGGRASRRSAASSPRSSATLELDEVFEDVLDSSQELFGAEAAGLWLLQPGRHPFELVAHRDLGRS